MGLIVVRAFLHAEFVRDVIQGAYLICSARGDVKMCMEGFISPKHMVIIPTRKNQHPHTVKINDKQVVFGSEFRSYSPVTAVTGWLLFIYLWLGYVFGKGHRILLPKATAEEALGGTLECRMQGLGFLVENAGVRH